MTSELLAVQNEILINNRIEELIDGSYIDRFRRVFTRRGRQLPIVTLTTLEQHLFPEVNEEVKRLVRLKIRAISYFE